MDFLGDENVPAPIIERLRADGHHVLAIVDARAGAPDADVLQSADLSGLILLTQDQDFGELVIRRALPVAGIVLLQLARLSLRAQVERISRSVAAEHDRLVGNLTVIQPTRVRRRALPVE